ncbi:MAG: response regulator transcription factor [Acidobacteriaceae bacterium]|nr:response regulator transcription factor [Acidobacteriaceae bacterium]
MTPDRFSARQRPSRNIRILVADDHLVYRIGIRNLIGNEPGFEVVGEASNGTEAIALYRELKPDVLLLDLRMPQKGGVEVVRSIAAEFANPRILIVTSYQTEDEVFQVLDAGAQGYILKDLGREMLIEAIETVYAGKRWTSPAIERQFASGMSRQQLTDRENEVLKLVAKGLTNREIANVFRISESTVKNHVNNLLSKLEVADRTEAVVFCLSHGILQSEEI